MPKTGVFTLTGPLEGKTMVILDKYPFVDGVFKTPALYAPLMARMLVPYYACELTYESTDDVEEGENLLADDGSLAVAATRGLTEGEKFNSQDLQSKLANAARIDAEEKALSAQRAEEQAQLDATQAAAATTAVKK